MKQKSLKISTIVNVIRVFMSIVFPLITFPYATRVLGATNLGKVTFGNSVIAFLLLFASLGISTYAIREGAAVKDKPEKFQKLVNEIFSLNIIFSIISYIVFFLILLFPTKLQNYKELLFIQSIIVILTTLGVEWIYNLYEDYVYITIRSFIVQIISMVLLFLFVRSKNDYYIYAIITVASNGGAYLFNYLNSRKYCQLKFTLKTNIKKHIKPLLLLFSNDLAQQVYINSDIIMLGFMTANYNVGLYSLSVKIYAIVKQVINTIVRTCIPRIAYLNSKTIKDEYYKLTEKLLRILILTIFPILTGLFVLSQNIVLILSGKEYIAAALPLKILSIALLFAVLSNYYINAILIINKKEKYVLIATIVSAVVNLGLNIVLIPILKQNGAALTTLIAESIVLGIAYFYGKKYTRLSKKIGKDILESICGIVLVATTYYCVSLFNLKPIIECIIVFALSIILYASLLLLVKNDVVIGVLESIKNKIINKKKKHN